MHESLNKWHNGPKIILLFACLIMVLNGLSCKSQKDEVLQVIEGYIKSKNPDVTDVKLDFFHSNPNVKDKAYAGVTITHGFASATGKPQLEPLGFILIHDNNGWKITEGNQPAHTTDPDKANKYLVGEK